MSMTVGIETSSDFHPMKQCLRVFSYLRIGYRINNLIRWILMLNSSKEEGEETTTFVSLEELALVHLKFFRILHAHS